MRQGTGDYLQNFKSIHTKLKEIDLRMRSCTPCNWNSSHDLWCGKGSGGYVKNFKSIRQKIKNFPFGGHFFSFFFGGGRCGAGGLDCSQYQILTHPRNGLKNPNMNFGNDRSHSLGGFWWQTETADDRQKTTTDRRQTDRKFESLCALWYLRLLRRLDNNNNNTTTTKTTIIIIIKIIQLL